MSHSLYLHTHLFSFIIFLVTINNITFLIHTKLKRKNSSFLVSGSTPVRYFIGAALKASVCITTGALFHRCATEPVFVVILMSHYIGAYVHVFLLKELVERSHAPHTHHFSFAILKMKNSVSRKKSFRMIEQVSVLEKKVSLCSIKEDKNLKFQKN